MTPEIMAALHKAAFAPERGWSAAEFASLCGSPYVEVFEREQGFALVRSIAGEAELLTLAVSPDHRRRGTARDLMQDWMIHENAQIAFLEVASDNHAAQALYLQFGFAETGRRKAYYSRPNGPSADALLMQAAVTRGKNGELDPKAAKIG